jgi:hypothetical protein
MDLVGAGKKCLIPSRSGSFAAVEPERKGQKGKNGKGRTKEEK